MRKVVHPAPTELLLIRHAPALAGGRLAGRRDVDADCGDGAAFAALRARLGRIDRLRVSPARRCAQTAAALWPDRAPPMQDARLWEQDFGDWEGMAHADLPDLGPLPRADLARHRPPGGESFADLCARVAPALDAALDGGPGMGTGGGGRVAIVAHAGVVRAALGLALDMPDAGLAFDVPPLSLTRILVLPGGGRAIACVGVTG